MAYRAVLMSDDEEASTGILLQRQHHVSIFKVFDDTTVLLQGNPTPDCKSAVTS